MEDGIKYKIENSYMKYGYITIMRLTIKRVIADDFTEYQCVSKNELLATRGKILLRGSLNDNYNYSILQIFIVNSVIRDRSKI